MPEKKVKINKLLCKGCGYCIEFCPKKVFEQSDELNEKGVTLPRIINEDECISCGLCVMFCPDFAITMEEEDE
ncbi:4Fe-4S dicluster domain-containing protein [Candidatus Bathyarchaeota archaeon]|nr:4Fe-4S dicluster domain-containing protein [Candidatus Bathyarchaeota archaeon]